MRERERESFKVASGLLLPLLLVLSLFIVSCSDDSSYGIGGTKTLSIISDDIKTVSVNAYGSSSSSRDIAGQWGAVYKSVLSYSKTDKVSLAPIVFETSNGKKIIFASYEENGRTLFQAKNQKVYDYSSYSYSSSYLGLNEISFDENLNVEIGELQKFCNTDGYCSHRLLCTYDLNDSTYALFSCETSNKYLLLLLKFTEDGNISESTIETDGQSPTWIVARNINGSDYIYWIDSAKEHILEYDVDSSKITTISLPNGKGFVNDSLALLDDGSLVFNSYMIGAGASVGTYKWNPETMTEPVLMSSSELDVKQIISLESL